MFQVDIKYVNFFHVLCCSACVTIDQLSTNMRAPAPIAAVYIVDTRRFLTYRIWLCRVVLLRSADNGTLFLACFSRALDTLSSMSRSIVQNFAHCYGRLQGSFGVDSQNTYAFLFGCFHNKYMQERNYRVQVALEIWVVFLWKDLSGLESLRETYTEGLDGLKTMSTMCLAPIIYLLFFSLCSCQHFSKKKDKKRETQKKSEIIFLHQPLLLCVILTNCLYASLFLWFRFRQPCMQPIELNSGWQTAWSWWWMEQMFVYIFSLNN